VCSNATRVFVQGGILNRFLPEFIRQAKLMKIGDPLDPSTTVGATISKEHSDKVLGYIKGAVKEGATIATGGVRVEVEGYFILDFELKKFASKSTFMLYFFFSYNK